MPYLLWQTAACIKVFQIYNNGENFKNELFDDSNQTWQFGSHLLTNNNWWWCHIYCNRLLSAPNSFRCLIVLKSLSMVFLLVLARHTNFVVWNLMVIGARMVSHISSTPGIHQTCMWYCTPWLQCPSMVSDVLCFDQNSWRNNKQYRMVHSSFNFIPLPKSYTTQLYFSVFWPYSLSQH